MDRQLIDATLEKQHCSIKKNITCTKLAPPPTRQISSNGHAALISRKSNSAYFLIILVTVHACAVRTMGHRHRSKHKHHRVKHEHKSRSSSSKRKKSRKYTDSSESDSDTSDEMRLREEERQKIAEQKKLRKALMKAHETPQQKRARRIAKKMAKEAKQRNALGWTGAFSDYSNGDNPFGDPQLMKPFMWQKKYEKEGRLNVTTSELIEENRIRLLENQTELEKIREKRLQREAMKNELEVLRRERENKEFVNWIKQETTFHLEQARTRSRIRMREGRAKPIDYLATYVSDGEDQDCEHFEFLEPTKYAENLTVRDYEDLLVDIKVYQEYHGEALNQFWNDMATVVQHRLNQQQATSAPTSAHRQEIHASVFADIEEMLNNKDVEHLLILEQQIQNKLNTDQSELDVGYWEMVLSLLRLRVARLRLNEDYKRRLKKYKQRNKNNWLDDFIAEAKKGMTSDEATFAVEENIQKERAYLWSDRFRPRKPRYFNRVHTGFEWNKYNQTHYDLENPPPKIVQGYRFNIFYPDLIEPKPPRFKVSPCENDSDFCILKIEAGPPYEDIAFKIVNKEWELSCKREVDMQAARHLLVNFLGRNFLRSSVRYRSSAAFNTIVLFVPQQEAWGLNILVPIIDQIKYIQSLKEIAVEIPQQSAITVDNVALNIDGVLYLRIVDPYKASYGVEEPEFAVTQLAQTTMRSEVGKITLDTVFREHALNKAATPWGITCMRYEIRDMKMPKKIEEAMQMQVEAERRKRASILESEGVRVAEINVAEGKKSAKILASEAEMQEKINRAQGEANAILARAEAKAKAIQIIANALTSKDGHSAATLAIAEQYVNAFGNLAKTSNTLILPADASNLTGVVGQALTMYKAFSNKMDDVSKEKFHSDSK
ncbi:Stomatin-like protein 2, mitochondrial [Trichinella pseudospiralis]|uniref:Splicing factor Cactin n=1 Tax=Trichinella pseudospiralis TaxID=6337 RepID=A0A0V1DVG2_TRIPS|nr:Stomatin-like protein 2, mitochondrial [Trichinella pseudospiralis]